MNIKELIGPVLFAFGITLLIQRWFAPQPQGPARMQAPQTEQIQRTLDRNVKLADTAQAVADVQEVKTDYGTFQFSTAGASLVRAIYEKKSTARTLDLETIAPAARPDQACFLVAADVVTPYAYKLIERIEVTPKPDHTAVRLHYRAQTPEMTIDKIFTVHNKNYLIDLAVTVAPKGKVYPRIFFSGPNLKVGNKVDTVAGVAQEQQELTKYYLTRARHELQDNFWITPGIFGAEDRYFLNALVTDTDHFVQRAYYIVEQDTLTSVIEGPAIEKPTTWNLSFYMGPKESAALRAVNPQLEQVLDYGWLGFIVRPMVWFFHWLLQYIHNLGLAIILFTILIRLLLLPLTLKAAKGAERAKEMQKKLQYLKQKYKDEPELFAQEQAELFKKHGMESLSGLGGGCLPVLIQMPVFFALNRMLSSSIAMCCAPFLWISDLSSPDPIILPVLVGLSSYLATYQGAQDNSQRITGFVIAIMFGAFAVGFPAGLSLYIVVSTVAGAAQMFLQRYID
jgi:YidC/Oxa1 family membrane protein insertase